MTTPQTTPTPRPAPQPASGSTATRAILIATSIVGGLALLTAGASAAAAAVAERQVAWGIDVLPGIIGSGSGTAGIGDAGAAANSFREDATGATDLEVDASLASLTIAFAAPGADGSGGGAPTDAVLEVSGQYATDWSLVREGDALVVTGPEGDASPENACLLDCGTTATLTLPSAAAGALAADISFDRGMLRLDGDFRALEVEADAGEIALAGSASKLALDFGTGKATVDLADVTTASIDLTTGEAEVNLTGEPPKGVEVDLRLGSATVTLPDGTYRVETTGKIGSVDNGLTTGDDAQSLVRVNADLGEVVLRAL